MTISHDALQNLYNDADFKVICTNVIDEEGHLPSYYLFVYQRNKRNTYFICCSNGTVHTFYRALDWIVTDPLAAIKDEINAHQGEYDF